MGKDISPKKRFPTALTTRLPCRKDWHQDNDRLVNQKRIASMKL